MLWGALLVISTGSAFAQLSDWIEVEFEQIDVLHPYDDWLLPLVVVQDSNRTGLSNGELLKFPRYGFLKSESDTEFVILGPDLRMRTFEKSTRSFSSLDFAEYSKQVVANSKQLAYLSDGSKVVPWVQSLVLARAAYHRGEFDSCERFMSIAGQYRPKGGQFAMSKWAFSNADFGEILNLLGDPKVTRKEVLARVQRYLNLFPGTEYSKRANALEDDLLTMIEQDARHEASVDVASLPLDQQIDEWIYRLRDLSARQLKPNEGWEIFPDIATNPESPAMQLVRIGNQAVPKLIERIGDSTPTRSTPYQHDLYLSDHLLTVGRCAELILSKIAGRTFGDGQSSELALEQVTAWWEEIKLVGEEQYLMERLERGGKVALEAASALVTKFPDVAFDCLSSTVDRSRDTRVQTKLLEMIGKLPFTEKTTGFFRHQLKNARELETRLAAARLLLPVERDDAIQAMIHEFRQMVTNAAGGHWPSDEQALIAFLANGESITAIAALQEAYDSRKVTERSCVILSFLDRAEREGTNPDLSTHIEKLLVHALSDRERRSGFTLVRKEGEFKNPCNSEIAGYLLHQLLPAEYRFEFLLPAANMETQRVQAINHWRRKNQLPEITNNATP